MPGPRTFTQNLKAIKAHSQFAVSNFSLPDSAANNGTEITLSTFNGLGQAARIGAPVLCKGPDGMFAYYVIDAERSTPQLTILRAL